MGEWVPAGKLRIGDAIRRADGSYGMVQASQFVYQPQPMYNLTVAAAHTYFVGDGQWLVHNLLCDSVRDEIYNIAKDFGFNQCQECANVIETYLKNKGISGQRIKFTAPDGQRSAARIWNDEFNMLVSTNGLHEIIEVDGYIFDNFYPRGTPKANWYEQNKFNFDAIAEIASDW